MGEKPKRVGDDKLQTISIDLYASMIHKIDEKRKNTELSRSAWFRETLKPVLRWKRFDEWPET